MLLSLSCQLDEYSLSYSNIECWDQFTAIHGNRRNLVLRLMYSRPELIMCLFCFIDTFDCFETMLTVGPGLVGLACSQWHVQPGSRLEALFGWLISASFWRMYWQVVSPYHWNILMDLQRGWWRSILEFTLTTWKFLRLFSPQSNMCHVTSFNS